MKKIAVACLRTWVMNNFFVLREDLADFYPAHFPGRNVLSRIMFSICYVSIFHSHYVSFFRHLNLEIYVPIYMYICIIMVSNGILPAAFKFMMF